jgi:uncharacterized Zn finger protein
MTKAERKELVEEMKARLTLWQVEEKKSGTEEGMRAAVTLAHIKYKFGELPTNG